MSGNTRLSRRAVMQGLIVGFPMDYRYGWDMAVSHHQKLLASLRKRCFISAALWSPTCTPWSIARRHENPAALEADMNGQAPAIIFMRDDIRQTLGTEQHHVADNPHNSDFWTKSDYASITDLDIMRTFVADQCSYGATNELGEPVRRRTRLDATFALRASTRHCKCTVAHGHLTGAFDGIKRTAKAAVFPKSFCDALTRDIMRISRLQTWGCERCRLGNKTEAEHARKLGNCKVASAAPP
eukprot:6840452-Pyramimonas_sp.AAC.3